MLIIGAKGHAKEILSILNLELADKIVFFDDISHDLSKYIYNKFPIISNFYAAIDYLKQHNDQCVLGIGNPIVRAMLFQKFSDAGFTAINVFAPSSIISSFEVHLGTGINVMNFAFISSSVTIGNGTLINARASIHHDCKVGDFVEVGPGATLLGGVTVGDFSFIGASATVLPNVILGKNSIIGAGAVVTKNVPDNTRVKGVPALKF